MSKQSLDTFLALVQRSKLIPDQRLAEVVNAWKQSATLEQLGDARHCAEHLVEQGLLTLWQCKKLLDGRHKGFYLGKYKLLDHLGTGGMSSVYLAEHLLMQRLVAIKVLPQNRVEDSTYLARFRHEGQAAAALDHENIVRAYDFDSEGRLHYLVMEYVAGADMHALVCRQGPLDVHTAAYYIAQAARGLEHAHRRGLIHRDIKPANLLVDAQGTVKILDMGLAKFTAKTRPAPDFAHEEHVLGTADYLAPEQAVNSRSVDQRADIYSLGCTLYFLLTGQPPFATGSTYERMAAHRQLAPPEILQSRSDVPLGLVAICQRMMAKQPDARYQTAAEVQQTLSQWLESEAAAGRTRLAGVTSAISDAALARSQLSSGSRLPPLTIVPDEEEPGQRPPPLSSAQRDTEVNLQRDTANLAPLSAKLRSPPSQVLPPGSQVLPVPEDTPSASPFDLTNEPRRSVVEERSMPFAAPWTLTAHERASGARSHDALSLAWILLLSALLIVALLLALFAYGL